MKRTATLLAFCLLAFLSLFGEENQRDTLLVGITQAAPFIIQNDVNSPEGISVYLWERIAEDLDQPFKYISMSFTDMLTALEDGSIDVSINPLTITSDRAEHFQFTHSFFATHSSIAAYEPNSFQKFLNFCSSIFDVNFLSGFLALVAVICFFGLLLWAFENKVNKEQFRSGYHGLWDGIWWSVVTMTTVGYGDKAPKSRGGKIVALLWMFSGLLFISGFTASIASRLTVNQLAAHSNHVLDFKELPVGCIKNSSTALYLKRNFFKDIHLYESVVDGLEAVSVHDIDAFLYDEPILKYRILETPALENLIILPLRFDAQFYAFGLPNDRTQLKNEISLKMLEQLESYEWKLVLAEYGLMEL